jgi:TIR domain
MNKEISDKAAITFAVGFYDALGAGRDVEFAFKLGCSAIRLEGIAEHLTPVLLKKPISKDSTVPDKPISEVTPAPMNPSTFPITPIDVFISYSHQDEDFLSKLVSHLSLLKRQGKIADWFDRKIEAGSEWEAQFKARLELAPVILLLISADFLASDYCYDTEMKRAIERHQEGTAKVIPIILRPCYLDGSPFMKLQALPKDLKPITQWDDQDLAFVDVVKGILRAVESLPKK